MKYICPAEMVVLVLSRPARGAWVEIIICVLKW